MVKKQKTFFIIIAILLGIAIGVLIWIISAPKSKSAEGVFYYKVEGSKADLFLIKGDKKPKKIISIDSREVDLGSYKPPRHSYISSDSRQMIYFKEIEEVPLESPSDEFIIVRIISKPILVDLKNGRETEINQPIDSSGLVFSPDNENIAWIKEVEQATYEGIEKSGEKRELWISRANGEDAQLLKGFDENVLLLKKWYGNYIYFQGLWDVNVRSLGRINVKTREVEYIVPRLCETFLENCKNINFSLTGNYFTYEIQSQNDENQQVTELYLGNFDKREFLEILTTDRISDLLWLGNEKGFFYTDQETTKKEGTKETIHLIDLKNQTDDKIYTGSYVSQLTISPNVKYLYFLEKQEQGEDFDLVRLNIRKNKREVILSGNYNHILLLQL